MLDHFPVDFTATDVREVLRILQTIYRRSEIERIVLETGLDPSEVGWDAKPALTWRSVFELAAGRGMVGNLLDTVSHDIPAAKLRLTELRGTSDSLYPEQLVGITNDYAFDSAIWKNFSTDGRAESIIVSGQPTFMDVSFLAVGLDKARSICRLLARFPATGAGTAFRVGPRHLLTNHHVLFNYNDNERRAVSVQAWFNYESDENGKLKVISQIDCDPTSIAGEKADDWALIRTNDPIPQEFPMLSLVGAQVPKVDDRVCIIQHPYGQTKKIAFQHNLVRSVSSDRIQYWTDTDLGSSGSPVFDESWSVVALHHFSVPAPHGDRISVRNQGRRIDRIVERMRELGVLAELRQ